mgnify:CR=1 FL=1
MNLKVVIHKENGGFWAEVPALKGCFTQGETIDEIKINIKEAIDGWFSVDLPSIYDEIIEVAV